MRIACPHCECSVDSGADACAVCQGSFLIAGRYRLESERGRGSGVVYRAVRVADGLPVAVKIVPLTHTDWNDVAQFERAARFLQGTDNPSLPRVHHFEQDDRGKLVLVREYLADDTLEERIVRGRHTDPHAFETLLEGLLRAAEFVHGLVPPLIHRDIQPSNVMFRDDQSWEPVLVDFESMIQETVAEAPPSGGYSSSYSAPETLHGVASCVSDLYSIGATMAFVATHQEPESLRRDDGRLVLDVGLAGLRKEIVDTLRALVEPDPMARPASATAALRTLRPTVVEIRHVGAQEMTPAQVDARVRGWLQAESNDARVLVPYLARLDALGYANVRDAVARKGNIAPPQLDQAVAQERARQQPARPPVIVAPVPPPPPYPSPRPPAPPRQRSALGCLGSIVFFSVLLAVGIGALVVYLALQEAVDIVTTGTRGPGCEPPWLALEQAPDAPEACVTYKGAARVLVGCDTDVANLEAFCSEVAQIPNAAPQRLDLGGAMAIRALAEHHGLRGLPDPNKLLAARTRAGEAPRQPDGLEVWFPEQPHAGPSDTPNAEMLQGPSGVSAAEAAGAETRADTHAVTFETSPPGARVRVGTLGCVTPCTLRLPAGAKEKFLVELPGYVPQSRKLQVLSDKTVTIALEKE